MTLFWLHVATLLVGTALHVVVRVYEVKGQQHRHYLAKWDEEFDRAMEEAAALSLLGRRGEANEALERAKFITHKYAMFFDSIN